MVLTHSGAPSSCRFLKTHTLGYIVRFPWQALGQGPSAEHRSFQIVRAGRAMAILALTLVVVFHRLQILFFVTDELLCEQMIFIQGGTEKHR